MNDLYRCRTADRLVDCVDCPYRYPLPLSGAEPDCHQPVACHEPTVAVCGACKWRRDDECGKTGDPAPSPLWAGCPMMEVR